MPLSREVLVASTAALDAAQAARVAVSASLYTTSPPGHSTEHMCTGSGSPSTLGTCGAPSSSGGLAGVPGEDLGGAPGEGAGEEGTAGKEEGGERGKGGGHAHASSAYWVWYPGLAQGVLLAKQAASHPTLLLPSFTPWEHHLAVYSVLHLTH